MPKKTAAMPETNQEAGEESILVTAAKAIGTSATLAADMLSLHEDVPSGLGISLVLLCVKSSATPKAAMALARAAKVSNKPKTAQKNPVRHLDL